MDRAMHSVFDLATEMRVPDLHRMSDGDAL